MKLDNLDMLKLIPAFMRSDETVISLCLALSQLIGEPGSKVKQQRIWDQIDELSDSALDELAWELNIDWYETSMSISVKRETIKNARIIMSHRGTKWAVEHVVADIFGDGVVKEWYEYDGEPFHFKISTTKMLDAEELEKFRKAVAYAQRRSCILDMIEYSYGSTATAYSAAAGIGTSITASGTAIHP